VYRAILFSAAGLSASSQLLYFMFSVGWECISVFAAFLVPCYFHYALKLVSDWLRWCVQVHCWEMLFGQIFERGRNSEGRAIDNMVARRRQEIDSVLKRQNRSLRFDARAV